MIWLLVIMILIALIAEWVSLKRSSVQLHYRLEPSLRSIEQGQELKLCSIIENATKYNIPYLLIRDFLPGEVDVLDSETLTLYWSGGNCIHQSALFIKKHQRVKRSIRVTIHERGVYNFCRTDLKIGDFLGIKETQKTVEQHRSVVVYPRHLSDSRLQQVLSDIFGEVSVRRFLYEDPMLVMGYRDYTGREPLRSISFPMTAKRNQMTVKEFDHTREEMVDVVFDVSYKGNFDHYFDQQEAMFSVVRTLCEGFEQKGISYRLITNAYYATAKVRGVNVIQSGGNGGNGFVKILEILGIASRAPMCNTTELLQHTFRQFTEEKAFVYVSQRRETETEEQLLCLERKYGVELHRVYGEDFEEVYLAGNTRGGKKEKMAV